MLIIKFFSGLFKSFINIYDDKGVRESYGEKFASGLAGADPVTGKRRISVSKILFRLLIIALTAVFILLLVRINITDTSLWTKK